MTTQPDSPLSGRRAEAARNDERILEAARRVFIANPDAPIAVVAEQAGVGISALYRRYPSKEDLLRTLCAQGLACYIAAVEAVLADERDAWIAFVDFMRIVVDADTHSLTLRLAGTFTPTEELYAESERARGLNERFFEQLRKSGAVRADVNVIDLALLFEQIAAIRVGDEERTRELRRRHLALALDALRTPCPTPLPGTPPAWAEIDARWSGRDGAGGAD